MGLWAGEEHHPEVGWMGEVGALAQAGTRTRARAEAGAVARAGAGAGARTGIVGR